MYMYGVDASICSNGGDKRDCRVECFLRPKRPMEVEEAGFRLLAWKTRCYMHKYAGSCTEAGVQGAISRLVALPYYRSMLEWVYSVVSMI